MPALAAGGHLTFASGPPSRPLPCCLGLSLLTSGLCSVPAALCPDGRGVVGEQQVLRGLDEHGPGLAHSLARNYNWSPCAECMSNPAAGQKSGASASAQQSGVTGGDDGSGAAHRGLLSCPPVPRPQSRCLWPGFPRDSEQAAIQRGPAAGLVRATLRFQRLLFQGTAAERPAASPGGLSMDQCGSMSLIPFERAVLARISPCGGWSHLPSLDPCLHLIWKLSSGQVSQRLGVRGAPSSWACI